MSIWSAVRHPLTYGPLAVFLGSVVLLGTATGADQPRTGEQIYRQQCAVCHGAAGEGTKDEYPEPLTGDKSVLELTRLIEKTMPKDNPKACVGPDAHRVATYIHETFYSPTAQARNKPARVELSRLTVRQYQNAAADLLGSFRGPPVWKKERGLKGEYFRSRQFRTEDRKLERIDPTVNFDFGEDSPDAEKFDPHTFSIRWEGSVLAPETGDYEFVVRTQHAARLWLNGGKTPLVDAWVKSDKDTEFRASLRLLGGRVYPLKLEFSKSKQGVDDSKKKMPKPAKAAIALLWKRPHSIVEPIPERVLSPHKTPDVFVLQTPFPPDDRSVGYERGTTISKAWDQATTDAAIEVAGTVTAQLNELAGVSDKDAPADRERRLRDFCLRFAERAFRRPLSEPQQQLYITQQFAAVSPPELAVKRVVLLVLKSPRFLYREAGGTTGDAFDVAARLSFGLWDSLPDSQLWQAAHEGKLATLEQATLQAQRMLDDLRTRSKLREFFWQWLKADQISDLAKDSQHFADFTPDIIADLRTSLELFVDDIVWDDKSDFRRLLLSETLPVNGRLAKFYGLELPETATFQPMSLDPEHRSGVLTHPYLLASFAYTGTSSPIHRGVFISRSLLGRALRPPPEAVAPLAPDLHADLTTRERIVLQTKASSCMSCHAMINPLGFALEKFDAVGRFRETERGKPINATGSYLTRAGREVQFVGARELARFLLTSDETRAAFVEQLFQYLVKQPVRAYGPEKSAQLQQSFARNEYHIRRLAAEIVASAAFLPISPEKPMPQ